MAASFKPIRQLLHTGTTSWSRWFSYVGLGMGVLLLLCAIQMFINIDQLVTRGNIRKNGFDYVPIMKELNNDRVKGIDKNMFTQKDIDEIKAQPFIIDAAPLTANQFRIQLSAGKLLPFQTEFFIESLENDFIDTVPPGFTWQPGQEGLPIIFSSDFFEIYTVFAPGQDLPRVTKDMATGIPMVVTCYGNGKEQSFVGSIVAFSDRVNSVLVPKTFLDWANQTFGQNKALEASRVFIKTKDANDPRLLAFLDSKGYELNRDKTILGRNKMIIQSIFSGLGVFGLMVVILALMLFSFYLQLIIARSKDNLQLLLTLGYSPTWLSRKVSNRFLPVYFFIIIITLGITEWLQWAFQHFAMHENPQLSPLIHWAVIATAVGLILLSLLTNYRMVRKQLYTLNK